MQAPFAASTPPGILASTAPDAPRDGSVDGGSDGRSVAGLDQGGAADLLGNHNLVLGGTVVEGASASVTGLVTSALSNIVATAADARATLADAAGHLTDGIDQALAGATSELLDALPASSATLSGVTPIAETGVAAVHDLDTTVATAVDDLPLAGADPAGGITTLVDLVQTSELFVVGQGDVAPEATEGGSMLDSLVGADDAIVPPVDDGGDNAIHHAASDPLDDLHLGI